MDEASLIGRARSGDEQAFGEIYDAYAQRIFAYIMVKVRHPQQAEDILQEVFLKAWRALGGFEGARLAPWLYRIATNAVTDHFRKLKSRPTETELDQGLAVAAMGRAPQDEVDVGLDAVRLKGALVQLPEAYQQVLQLRFVGSLSVREAAATLGRSELAVRLLQYRALGKLKQALRDLTK